MSAAIERLGFAQSRLVRHSAERDEALLPSIDDPAAGIVLMAGDRIVLQGQGSLTAILDSATARRAQDHGRAVFLGRLDERPVFAAALAPEAIAAYPRTDFQLRDLRAVAAEALVPAHELGLLATATSLLSWHARHGFCANCGAPTKSEAGGFRRACAACGTRHFPRTDPVAIMLVHRGDACLLARAPHFRERMYSCLAGFIEPGETIEDAVRRETAEETGIRVGAVRYHASQPWPFPSSLMIGCIAEATSETITIDPAEIEDARWVAKTELAEMLEHRHPAGLILPPPMAIAHLLLRDFVDGRV